ncbi:glycosyltransferase family 10 domain-containing protein [Sulfitobacter sp.]|uniref:glycosyltransferase family 10 domain-containing protein n=1 Tax=Sulfitobacter sp. TaxID=1903071 RepID=UPI0030027EC9
MSHSKDLDACAPHIKAGGRLVLLSEEPFWDSVWGRDPLRRFQKHSGTTGPIPFACLNHFTSDIYNFTEIPYFLLTDTRFFTRYASWFRRNAARDADQWRTHFAGTRHRVAFLAEYRNEARFDVRYDGHDIFGMGTLRTQIALACKGPDVLRSGAGWNTLPRRQDLPDWHLDKFLDLDGQCRILSAIENTHHANYVSEKFFDAFAVGAVPLYIAGPGHRVHDLVPAGSFINLYGLAPDEAAARIDAFEPDAAFIENYRAAQMRLGTLFGTPAAMVREYARLGAALKRELAEVSGKQEM